MSDIEIAVSRLQQDYCAAVSTAGAVLRSMQNRLTWGLRMNGQNAVVVHEHTSAPIGFEDMKAILQRSPGS